MTINDLWRTHPAWWVRGINLLLWLGLPLVSLTLCHSAPTVCASSSVLSAYTDFYLSLYLLSALSGYLPLVCYLLLALVSGEIMARLCARLVHNPDKC